MFQKYEGMEKHYEEEGGITIFCWNFFFSQCRNILSEELINVLELLRHGKFFCRRRRYHYFPLETFFLTVPKNFVRGIIQCFRNMRAWNIFLQKKDISIFSVGIFFSHSAEKFREGNHSMFQKISGMEKFYAEGGDISIIC